MKKIFIYFSLTGNGDVVSNYYKNKGYEIRKVISKYKYPKNKFFMILTGGYRASFNKKDKLINFDNDINNYDEIIIGSPIWNDRLSAPINRVLDELNLANKKLTFVLYSGSGTANKASEKINELYKANIIILKEPKSNNDELNKLKSED